MEEDRPPSGSGGGGVPPEKGGYEEDLNGGDDGGGASSSSSSAAVAQPQPQQHQQQQNNADEPQALFDLNSGAAVAFAAVMILLHLFKATRSSNPMTSLAASMRSSRSIGSSATSLASSAASKRGGAARILLAPQSPMSMTSMLRTVPPPPSLTSSASTFSTTHRPRGFFASAASASPSSPASSSSLISVLDTEIEYEKEHAPSGPPELPEGWAFDDAGGDGSEADGSARLTLRSTRAPAGETVTIDLLIDDQDEEDDGYGFGDGDEEGDDDDVEVDDEEEEVDDAGIVFTVSVAKESSPGADLLFDCRSDGTYLQIMHVSLEKKQEGKVGAGDDDDDAEFSGPHFDELDEALQAEFESYLDERGVTPFLGGALAALAEDKEAREYAAWLVKVRDFVAGR